MPLSLDPQPYLLKSVMVVVEVHSDTGGHLLLYVLIYSGSPSLFFDSRQSFAALASERGNQEMLSEGLRTMPRFAHPRRQFGR